MGKICIIALSLILSVTTIAQNVKYETFIYTSEELEGQIQDVSEKRGFTRGYAGDLFEAWKGATKTLASGYITSAIDLGVSAIGSLITINERRQKAWEEEIKQENVAVTRISTLSEINNFYKKNSFDSAMDPLGMCFNGLGCLRKEGNDTVFYISCHIDNQKLYRIIDHSKFELSLDTLIINPRFSNLPNSAYDFPFSFEERKNLKFTIDMELTSSWINATTVLQQNQKLGAFQLAIAVSPDDLDKQGVLHYVRNDNEPSKFRVVGESFIVPRSYMGFRDQSGKFRDSWGTGEYKLSLVLKETCDITEQFRKRWKKDWKKRKELVSSGNIFIHTWQVVTSQNWDELAEQWVITTLKAPAAIVADDLIEKMKLNNE